MERIVIIDKVFDKRTVTSKNGSFEVQPLLLSETEKKVTASGAEYENKQSYYVELCGNSATSFALPVGTKVRANLLFSAKESNGRVFQSIKTFYINPVND
jgi:hypothetical protein